MISRLRALQLLDECTGVDIWPVEYCREVGLPEPWIEELADAFESGFESQWHTIYYQDRPVNQFHGVHDLAIAGKIGRMLGIDVDALVSMYPSWDDRVRAIREAVEEG